MRMLNTTVRRRPRRGGATAVELAIVLPLLMLIGLGCIDFGRFAYHYIALTNAARAGAEYATMNPYGSSDEATWKAKIQTTAQDEMVNQVGCDPADVKTATSMIIEKDVSGTWGTSTTATTVTVKSAGLRRVEVEATYDSFRTIVSWPGIPDQVTLYSKVVMRVIR